MDHSDQIIELRGVRVHNLQGIDLDLPLGKLIVFTGVSGAGKSSLAFDTLYAEGQRRYVETFPTYARQFLERLEQPAAESIGRIPPAVAVRQAAPAGSRRATLGTTTEVLNYLRLLFARAGELICPDCREPVVRHSPGSVARLLSDPTVGGRIQIGFPIVPRSSAEATDDVFQHRLSHLGRAGFSRAVVGEATVPLSEVTVAALRAAATSLAIVDRLTLPIASVERLTDSLETAFREGSGTCVLLSETAVVNGADVVVTIDGRDWRLSRFHEGLVCARCEREFPIPEPAHFSFQSPLGACPACRGLGVIDAEASADRSPRGSQKTASSAPGTVQIAICLECNGTRLQSLALAVHLAGQTLPALTARTIDEALAILASIQESPLLPPPLAGGGPGWGASGCGGQPSLDSPDKPPPTATAPPESTALLNRLLPPVVHRLELLRDVGLGYLTLDRPMRTLSRGEAQRARLAGACGSNLVNLLYVLDEPTAGLHPHDTERLIGVLLALRDAGNTVVVVEHDPAVIRRADRIVDLGPQAGQAGGRIIYEGPPAGVVQCPESITGDYLAGRRTVSTAPQKESREPTGWLHLDDVHHHNLHGVSVAFPLGVLCVVTGVSGSGKSSLVVDTLLPAVAQALQGRGGAGTDAPGERDRIAGLDRERERRRDGEKGTSAVSSPALPNSLTPLPPISPSLPLSVSHSSATSSPPPPRHTSLTITDPLAHILHLDASPIGRSPRGMPASYLGIFSEIRSLFAGTAEAKVQNLSARHFSFNTAGGGRCETCTGTGSVAVDMQFLPDVVVTCPDCHGTSYRREILAVKYRGLSIAEVLSLTARDAFMFFRGRTRIQRRLKYMKEAGLEYLTLGQPARTLSGGESQRLKLAAFLAQGTRARTLILLEEPTTGLHPQDVTRLLDCWNTLLAAGHALIVIEHNLDVIASADHVIDLGPGSGAEGGRVVAAGTPAEISREPRSITGRYLQSRVEFQE